MKLPGELLQRQFAARVVRGTILRFEFSNWKDPKKTDPGPKFAVVLNNPSVTDPIYLALTTSKVDNYARFPDSVFHIAAGEYDCFPIPTAIAFRRDPESVTRAKLEEQIHAQKLIFVGDLKPEHLLAIDRVIRESPYISKQLIQFITAQSQA